MNECRRSILECFVVLFYAAPLAAAEVWTPCAIEPHGRAAQRTLLCEGAPAPLTATAVAGGLIDRVSWQESDGKGRRRSTYLSRNGKVSFVVVDDNVKPGTESVSRCCIDITHASMLT